MGLTRRERAAMGLALECLRQRVRGEPCRVPSRRELLEYAAVLQHGDRELSDALLVSIPEYDGSGRPEVRARLALYLRARLRAEGREEIGFGRWVCAGCGSEDLRSIYEQVPRFVGDKWKPACRTCGGEQTDYTCRVTPLWELAPSHGGGR